MVYPGRYKIGRRGWLDIYGLTTMSKYICYCFEYTRQDIEADFKKNGRSLIMAKIRAEKTFGNCQCATKNPKGS